MWPVFASISSHESQQVPNKLRAASVGPAKQCLLDLEPIWSQDIVCQDLHSARLAVQQLDESISLLPTEEKTEYLEAHRLASSIVATESNPLRFLRTDGMNPWCAASRLAHYWKCRKELFQDRWLLPMDLSGKGAFSQSDVENIKKNVFLIRRIPGQATVIYIDFSKAPNQDELFPGRSAYFVSTAIQIEDYESHGVILIQNINPQFFMRRRKKGRAFEIIRKALPARVRKAFFLCRQSSQPNISDSLIHTALSMMGMVAEFFLGDAPEFLSEANQQEAVDKLRQNHVPDYCIPYFLGGRWDMQGCQLWNEDHSRSPVFSAIETQAGITSPGFSAGSPGIMGVPSTRRRSKRGRPPNVLSAETAMEMKAECDGDEEFIKKRNALYSRRLYYKKKQEKNELTEKACNLAKENERLRKENEWLESLIAETHLYTSEGGDDFYAGAQTTNKCAPCVSQFNYSPGIHTSTFSAGEDTRNVFGLPDSLII